MKIVFRITAILNLSLVALACICAVISAINKSGDLFAGSILTVLVSIFPTAMMLSLCNDFKDTNKVIAEPKEERRWRKFPDEKPTKDIKFLVINERKMLQCCYYSTTLKEFQIPVTHWMPLPSAPKEVK